MKHYGQKNPPSYNLENIKNLNILIIGGKEDMVASEDDYSWLYQVLYCKNKRTILWSLNYGHCGLLYPENVPRGENKKHINKMVDYINQIHISPEEAFEKFRSFDEDKTIV